MTKRALTLLLLPSMLAAQTAAPLELSLKQAIEMALAPDGNARVQIAQEAIRQAEARFSASMLARKLIAEGGSLWPRPWRGRNTISRPSSSPNSSSSEGSPKAEPTLTHCLFLRPSMS